MGGFYFLKQEEKEEHVLREMVQKRFTSRNHMPSGEPRQKCHLYFHRKFVTYFGDCANQVCCLFFFLISYWLPSPMTLPGVYPLICICCTKRVSSFGGVWAQLDEYIYADFLSIFPSSQVSLIY